MGVAFVSSFYCIQQLRIPSVKEDEYEKSLNEQINSAHNQTNPAPDGIEFVINPETGKEKGKEKQILETPDSIVEETTALNSWEYDKEHDDVIYEKCEACTEHC